MLIATDVLSEGQNLQDGAIIVNYDLPWAIIRLIQRAGRVDRIGQKAEKILCYSFLPADGVERIIQLRARVRQRLKKTPKSWAPTRPSSRTTATTRPSATLFTEKAGILDGEADTEVDLALLRLPDLEERHRPEPCSREYYPGPARRGVCDASPRPHERRARGGAALCSDAQGNDALAWVNAIGESISESQFTILKAAACEPDTPSLPRRPDHHEPRPQRGRDDRRGGEDLRRTARPPLGRVSALMRG